MAKVKGEKDNLVEYAKRTRSLQVELGVPQAPFRELGMS